MTDPVPDCLIWMVASFPAISYFTLKIDQNWIKWKNRIVLSFQSDIIPMFHDWNGTIDFAVKTPRSFLCVLIILVYPHSLAIKQAATGSVPSAWLKRTTLRGAFDSCALLWEKTLLFHRLSWNLLCVMSSRGAASPSILISAHGI